MLRTFDEHVVRRTVSLDGAWDFEPCLDGEAPTAPDGVSCRGTIYNPTAWETQPGLEAFRGQAWFQRRIQVPEDRSTVRLVFGGVSHTADVFFDGQKVAHHEDAFTPFEAIVAGVTPGDHTLSVRVDNTFGAHAALHKENDYYTYGGITRPAEAQFPPALHLAAIRVTPRQENGAWRAQIAVDVRNAGITAAEGAVTVELAGQTIPLGTAEADAGASVTLTADAAFPDAAPWSERSPTLYHAVARLDDGGGRVVDDLIDRVGFRTVRVEGQRLLLNGREVRLRGVNRHEDHPSFGCALPLEQMQQDLAIIRDLGCNFVRTSHYPNDLRFLDRCDELGIYVWEESHARNVPMDAPRFAEQIDASTREMVRWHFNRPCVVIWGILNECESHRPERRHHYERLLGMLREMDGSRPLTYASNRTEEDQMFDLVDIVSVNRYTGWYGADLPAVEPSLLAYLDWLHGRGTHAGGGSVGGAGKPVILSEFGAGAVPGYHARSRCHWSEEYQADVLDEELRVYLHHPEVIGAAIWQFCDVRITADRWQTRPRSMNNKGVVDEYRRPKLSYQTVQSHMRRAAGREN